MTDRPGRRRPQHPRPPARPGSARPQPQARRDSTSWDHVAAWYDQLVGETGSDYHQHVILPAALALLDVKPGERVLDVACGQGVLARPLLERGVGQYIGVDASAKLIEAAQGRIGDDDRARFFVGDARNLGEVLGRDFRGFRGFRGDAAACIMAVHDFDPIEPMLAGVAAALRPGGRFVMVLMHPCFRVPRQSSWAWDETKRTQYRRLDRYHTPMQIPIAVSPGRDPSQHTAYFHRPLEQYINGLGDAGLAVVRCDELRSHRRSEPGGRSRGENRAKTEFPLFLAIKAIKT